MRVYTELFTGSQFIIKSTEAREQSKFEFTKSLSVVLDLITTIGQEYGLSANDLSHLDLNTLLKYLHKYKELKHLKSL